MQRFWQSLERNLQPYLHRLRMQQHPRGSWSKLRNLARNFSRRVNLSGLFKLSPRRQSAVGLVVVLGGLVLSCLGGGPCWALDRLPGVGFSGRAVPNFVRIPAVLPGLGKTFTGEPSPSLGLRQGTLHSCPRTPNCVVSQGGDETHRIAPITYQGDRAQVRTTLLQVLSVVPRTVVTQQGDDYIRYESTSRLLGFVDDGEFYLPPDQKVIHLRAAARMGESDLGVNRRRLEQIRLALKDLGV